MSLQKQRAVAAVVGGLVADAATMGLHWIYDADKLRALVADAAPEFHAPPSCPFYEYASGALSPYGDEVLPLLEFVAATGAFEPSAYADASYRAAKHYQGYLNGAFRELVKKGDAGERYPHLATEDKDLHGAIKTPVLVAKCLGSGGDAATLVATTTAATQVHQIGQDATDAAVASALLLHAVVEGAPIASAVQALTTSDHLGASTRARVQDVLDAVERRTFPDATAAIDRFGKACPLPGSLQGALYVLLTTSGYTAAVRANLVAGGDNCSRAILVGACAAASAIQDASAADPVPADWKAKTTQYAHIETLARQLVQ